MFYIIIIHVSVLECPGVRVRVRVRFWGRGMVRVGHIQGRLRVVQFGGASQSETPTSFDIGAFVIHTIIIMIQKLIKAQTIKSIVEQNCQSICFVLLSPG